MEFLRNRNDATLFGAQAVNAYVDEPRMTQDVEILSTRAAEFAEELRSYLVDQFHVAVRVRVVAGGLGFRVYELRQPKNRHFADVRQVNELPPNQLIADVRVPLPGDLIAQKLISLSGRSGQPKADTDRRDFKVMLLAFPELKTEEGLVTDRLLASNANARAMDEWRALVATEILAEDDAW